MKPHDHQTWGVVVGVSGSETNIHWKRRDDGNTPGNGDLVERHRVTAKQGDVLAFMPNDIHSVINEGEETSLSLHIYGKALAHVERSEFAPEAGAMKPRPVHKRG